MKIIAIALLVLALAAAPGVASAASWGAIAYSPSTQALGWTYNAVSEYQAEAGALSRCDRYADDCISAISFRNACGAVAVGNNGGWGSDWGTDHWEAQQSALGACSRHDSGCYVIRWQCSGAQ